ncbi:MAG: LiaI-LiaF-like domain-containing protein [Terracidiphilus sp.]
MDCVNHTGVNATAYCQNCGKALCANCVRTTSSGQILCEPCLAGWQSYQQPFAASPPGMPSPAVAAVLGIIPGVGAMYNGQFIKGLIHVVIFAALVSATHVWGLFGILIAGWVFYQVFDAYHTARARRDGEPLPDPLGLNEVGNWFGTGGHAHTPPPPGPGPSAGNPAGSAQQAYQPPYQQPYQGGGYTPPAAGFVDPGAPPVPPMPPVEWRRREPVGAVVLIALGVLFLLAEFGVFSGRVFEYMWPLLLIALGVWLIARRLEDTRGGSR